MLSWPKILGPCVNHKLIKKNSFLITGGPRTQETLIPLNSWFLSWHSCRFWLLLFVDRVPHCFSQAAQGSLGPECWSGKVKPGRLN